MRSIIDCLAVAALLGLSACGGGGGSGGENEPVQSAGDAQPIADGNTTGVVTTEADSPDTTGAGTSGENSSEPPSGEGETSGGEVQPVVSRVQGLWSGPCIVDDDGTGSEVTFFIVSGFNFEVLQSSDFDRNDCLTPELNYSRIGSFVEVREIEVPGRGTQVDVDVTTESYVFTMVNQSAAIAANNIETCGISNWSPGVSFDVSDCFNPSVPYVEYDSYLVEGELLYFGAGGSAETPDQRPTEISTTPSFERPQ